MRRLIFLAVFWGIWPIASIAADVAMVGDDQGFALLFKHRGNCYAAMPKHVARDNRLALSTALPRTRGSATVFTRHEDVDLALALVEGDIASRCIVLWPELSKDLGSTLFMNQRGVVRMVQFGGKFTDRLEVEVARITDRFIYVQLTDGLSPEEFRQGASGSVLSIDEHLAGIAINAGSTRDAAFLRMDEMVRLLSPFFEDAPSTELGQSGFRIEAFSPGQSGVTALESGGFAEPWITEWTGAPIEFELTLSDQTPIEVNQIMFVTDMINSGSNVTPPQRIKLAFDVGPPGQPYWRSVAAPDMTPSGILNVTTGGQLARRIKVSIESVWFTDRPLRLDSITWE